MQGRALEIRLLGPPEIQVGGARLEVDTRKAIALLAYLALEGSASRDVLATLFWREADTDRARGALRRTLSALRSALGPDHLQADRQQVTLDGKVHSDIAEFSAAMEATRSHGHDPIDVCIDCIPHLRRATDLYRGEFLEGFSVRDSPEFEEWVRTSGEHYRSRAGETFNRLASALAAAGEYTGAITAVGRWIELDPLHEPAHRQLMLLHAWSGDRPGAIEAYRRCVAVLGEELAVAPLEETTELHDAILDEDLPPAPGARRRVVVTEAATRPPIGSDLINRSGQLSALLDEVGLASTGGRVVAVTGEPWMGKTRLLEEFVSGLSGSGGAVVRARGFRAESSLPFGVVVQVLRALPGFPDSASRWARRELSRLVPNLIDDDQPPPQDTYGETRLFDAVVSVLAAVPAPSIIWVDDAQWCDPASGFLLGYLANRIDQTRCLLVLSLRPGDPACPPPLVDLINPPTKLITMGPLSAENLATVTPPEHAEVIVSETGGIPLLVSEYLAEGPLGLRVGIRRFVEAHLSNLRSVETQILTAAAVLDGICDLDLLRATSGRSDEEIVEAMELLVGRGLIRMSDDGASVSFALAAVEQQVYETTSVARRRLLHRRAASVLRDRAAVVTDVRLVTALARHLQMSGAEAEAAIWHAQAGDLAFAVYANAEAEAAYRLAQALGHPEPARVRLSLARLFLLSGRYRDASTEYQTVAATSEGADRARAEHGIGEVHRRLGRLDLAAERFRQAERDHPEPELLYADWALLAHRQGEVDRARELAERSLKLAETSGGDSQIGRAHHLLGVVTTADEAAQHFDRALALVGDDPAQRMASLNGLAHALARKGDHADALPLVTEALELAETIGDRHRQAALLSHLADLHQRSGHTERAEELVTASARLFAEIEPEAWEPEIWLLTRW